jgi:Do/DeqQ family serine protease
MKTKFLSKRNLVLAAGAAIVLTAGVAFGSTLGNDRNNSNVGDVFEGQNNVPAILTANTGSAGSVDFTQAAESAVDGVVHVQITGVERREMGGMNGMGGSPFNDPFFDFFFGDPGMQQQQPRVQERPVKASGSGVIISTDGYIVTNNHVIDNATEIEVILNDKRSFTATIVGQDPNTDIALIKVDATDLTPIPFGNSDNLRVGEWVLAIGNPFNLTSTVTAGIISAKARNINILDAEMKIESFIQTDAAVNPGNSGGALVNTRGELIGINTAIASQTGSYAGYAFAVPVSIVSKIVTDLKQFGEVQRAVLGVVISDITDELAKEKKIDTLKGAYVQEVSENSSAEAAGIKAGDVITAVNGEAVNSVAELQEHIGRFRPGDKASVTVLRDGKSQKIDMTLKNRQGNTDVVKAVGLDMLGASLQDLSDAKKKSLGLRSGVEVTQVTNGGKFDDNDIQKGFVIQKINGQTVRQVSDVEAALKAANTAAETALFISGVYPDGKTAYYAVNLKE